MTRQGNALRLIQSGRIVLALLIPLPFFLFRYVWDAVNSFYHPETYDPQRFWLSSIPELAIAVAAALFVGFWRFRSQDVGKTMVFIGLAIVAASVAWVGFAL